MQEFLLLEQELTKLEDSGFNPTKASSILPPSAYDSTTTTNGSTTNGIPQQPGAKTRERFAELVRHLNPHVLPEPAASTSISATPFATADAPPEPSATSLRRRRDPSEPLEALWWDIVGPSPSSSLLFGAPDAVAPQANGTNGTHLDESHSPEKHVPRTVLPPLAPALAASMPHVPWLGYSATPYETSAGLALRSPRKARSKDSALNASSPAKSSAKAPRRTTNKQGKEKTKKTVKVESNAESSIASRMRRNCETLRNIRRVGGILARESTLGDLVSDGRLFHPRSSWAKKDYL